MRIAPTAAIAAFVMMLPGTTAAQRYERHWHTSVVAAPTRTAAIVTNALPAPAKPAGPSLRPASHHAMTGIASYYWQGQKTASGEPFDKNALTAAHRTLPMNTRIKVTHVDSGRSVVVRINDRGPFKPGRVVDLSDRAAEILGFKPKGLAHVKMVVVE
jgi:rare lipoprotein A